jgi:hypothetical protein
MLTGGPADLRCDVCGANLASGDPHRAILRWWDREDVHGAGRGVVAFAALCAGRCSAQESSMRWAEFTAPGVAVGQRDGPLAWFTGRWAIVQLARLMRDYAWSDRTALERCLDTLVRASSLPDGSGPP